MDDNVPEERHEPKSRPLEMQNQRTTSSNSDVYLLSPSLDQQTNNDNEPLIRPTVSQRHPAVSFSTGYESFIRKPVLPPRPSSISPIKQAQYIELNPVTPRDPSPENTFKDNAMSTPKAFRKSQRFLGLNLGYWRQPARHFSIFLILASCTIIPLYFAGWAFGSLGNSDITPFMYDCYLKEGGWSFVGINLRIGDFSYGSAKALDLAWNWIIGRGVQALLMLLAYRVFNDALIRVAEMTPLSFELYARLSLYTTRMDVLWYLLKALFQKGNWRTKAIFVWLCISIIYLVTFPSLMDACSGYESSYSTFFEWPNSTLESTDDFQYLDWNYDPVNYTTITSFYSTVAVCTTYVSNPHYSPGLNFSYRIPNMTEFPGSFPIRFPSAVCTYTDNETTNDPPGTMHDIINLYYWNDEVLNETWWDHFRANPLMGEYQNWASWAFYPSDPSSFRCVTANGVYQWGFSSEWLFVVAVINSCWLVGIWILWLDCDTNSELCKKGRRLGLWRAVADISEAMREELGPNICAYSEKELTEALRNRPPIKYYVKHGTEQEPGHIGLSTQRSGKVRLRWDHEYGTSTHGNLKGRLGMKWAEQARVMMPLSEE